MSSLRTLSLAAGAVAIVTSAAVAQPADRAASIATAITNATAANANSQFLGAELRIRSGIWVVEVDLATAANAADAEVRVNATTGAIISTETAALSVADLARAVALRARAADIQRTPAQALAAALAAIPNATLNKVELGIEDGLVAYKVEMLSVGRNVRVNINATTGTVIGSGGGGGGGLPTFPGNALIGTDNSVSVALAAFPGTVVVNVEFRPLLRRRAYEVKLLDPATNTIREVKVNALTGAIIETRVIPGVAPSVPPTATTALTVTAPQAADAFRVALPTLQIVTKVEVTVENGIVGYDVRGRTPAGLYRAFVNGSTGAVTRVRRIGR